MSKATGAAALLRVLRVSGSGLGELGLACRGERAWDLGLRGRGEWVKQDYGELGENTGRWEVWGDACRNQESCSTWALARGHAHSQLVHA